MGIRISIVYSVKCFRISWPSPFAHPGSSPAHASSVRQHAAPADAAAARRRQPVRACHKAGATSPVHIVLLLLLHLLLLLGVPMHIRLLPLQSNRVITIDDPDGNRTRERDLSANIRKHRLSPCPPYDNRTKKDGMHRQLDCSCVCRRFQERYLGRSSALGVVRLGRGNRAGESSRPSTRTEVERVRTVVEHGLLSG